jgi:hypothetical protein
VFVAMYPDRESVEADYAIVKDPHSGADSCSPDRGP